jgi:hypothetical protein
MSAMHASGSETSDGKKRAMNDAKNYWIPVCDLVSRLRCWVRVAWKEDGATQDGHWGQLLTMPVEDYLEGPGGPISIRHVEWVEVSTNYVRGGIAGRPLQMIDAANEILAALRELRRIGSFEMGLGRSRVFLKTNRCE